jgi:hypothetical protein
MTQEQIDSIDVWFCEDCRKQREQPKPKPNLSLKIRIDTQTPASSLLDRSHPLLNAEERQPTRSNESLIN